MTDSSSNNTDTPGHGLPDALDHDLQYAQPITTWHGRQVVLPLESAADGNDDRDVCVCIACHTRYGNNTALRRHGAKENHRPYGCICGDTFTRLDTLTRHIASKNKISKFHCPLCEHDESTRTFARVDHLPQHLRTYHKIPAGKIPEAFTSSLLCDSAEDSTPPSQPPPSFPCLIPGCNRTGQFAYLQQIDLDEHILFVHHTLRSDNSVQRALGDPVTTWTTHNFEQDPNLHVAPTVGQDVHYDGFLQSDPSGISQTEGEFMGNSIFVGSPNFSLDNEFDVNYATNYDFSV